MAKKVTVPKELKEKLYKLRRKDRNKKIKNILLAPFTFIVGIFRIKDYKNIFYDKYEDETEEEQELKSLDNNQHKSILHNIKPFIDISDDDEYEEYHEFMTSELKPTFYDLIIRYADKLNISDSELYKKAYVDRRLFSKIRQGHKPNIKTVIRLGLALELNEKDFESLLNSCNYSLYEDKYFDVAIKYFVKNKIYNIDRCNDILYSCKLDLLLDYE